MAKYRWLAAKQVILVLAVPHQREAGFTEESQLAHLTSLSRPNRQLALTPPSDTPFKEINPPLPHLPPPQRRRHDNRSHNPDRHRDPPRGSEHAVSEYADRQQEPRHRNDKVVLTKCHSTARERNPGQQPMIDARRPRSIEPPAQTSQSDRKRPVLAI
jgi:hypothetical protein